MIEMLRREYRLTADEIAGKLNLARSTVAAWLTRRGLGRLAALEPKQPPVRYQRQHPGELIHLDIKKLARFERVGHRIIDLFRKSREHSYCSGGSSCPTHAFRKSFRMRPCGLL